MRKVLPIALRRALDLIVPPCCWMCDALVGDRPNAFCEECERRITTDPDIVCPRCASAVPELMAKAGVCPNCKSRDWAFERVVRMGPYAGTLREAILRMKVPVGEAFAESLAALAAPHLRDRLQGQKLDGVIPVPLHWRRRFWRGYNQSEISARAIAKAMKLPLLTRVLFRTKWTEKQFGVEDRHGNVRGCFSHGRADPSRRLGGRTVLLVDDVLTSGATADEAARVLQTLGVKTVVAVLAHESPRPPL